MTLDGSYIVRATQSLNGRFFGWRFICKNLMQTHGLEMNFLVNSFPFYSTDMLVFDISPTAQICCEFKVWCPGLVAGHHHGSNSHGKQ